MDLKEIQSLIRFVARSGATEVELETDGVKISIKTQGQGETKETTAVQHVSVAAPPRWPLPLCLRRLPLLLLHRPTLPLVIPVPKTIQNM